MNMIGTVNQIYLRLRYIRNLELTENKTFQNCQAGVLRRKQICPSVLT